MNGSEGPPVRSRYGHDWAQDYDALYEQRDDLDMVSARLAELAGPGPALEFGLGTGRTALPLIARGVAVHGIEAAPEMVDVLRVKPGGDTVPVTLGDMAHAVAGGPDFAIVYCTFSTLFLLPDQAEQVACFANAARHLLPGGVFVIEAFVFDPDRWQRQQTVGVSRVEPGLVDLLVGRHDPVHQRITNQHVLVTESGVRLRPNTLRYAWPAELDLMAALAGLRLRARWADWTARPFTATDTGHVSVYERGPV